MVHAVNGVSLATSFFFYDRLLFASVIARVSDYSSSILPQLLNVDIFWLGNAKLVRVMAIFCMYSLTFVSACLTCSSYVICVSGIIMKVMIYVTHLSLNSSNTAFCIFSLHEYTRRDNNVLQHLSLFALQAKDHGFK